MNTEFKLIREGEKITSILRLNDNVTFKIGDTVTDFIYTEEFTINAFHIHFEKLVVYVSKGSLNTTLYPSLMKLKTTH